MIFRSICFFAVVCATAAGPWWLAVAVGMLYIAWFQGVEIVLVGILADGVYGTNGAWPWYTIIFSGSIILNEWLRPNIFIYNER